MFRLVHFSDVHLGPLPKVRWRELVSKRSTGYWNWKRNRARSHLPETLARLVDDARMRNPDHIAVTGDLINIGLDDEIAGASEWLEALGHPQAVSVVCGNHDAYVPGVLEKALAAWQPYVRGDENAPVTGPDDYPLLRRRGEISFIMCNSAEPSPFFMATGRFRQKQAKGLSHLLETEGRAGQFRVVLIHHPPIKRSTPIHKRLMGQSLFRECVKSHGAELVLHGHTHLDTIFQIPGAQGDVPVVGVPSGAQAFRPGAEKRKKGKPAARYNLFNISRGPQGWRIAMQEYGYRFRSDAIELVAKHQLR